jgi:hypothetical protein
VTRPDNDPPEFLDLAGKLGIGGHPTAHPFAGMQYRGVITAEPMADLLQARALQHLKAQQDRDMAGQHDGRQVSPTEKLAARQAELLGDDGLDEAWAILHVNNAPLAQTLS